MYFNEYFEDACGMSSKPSRVAFQRSADHDPPLSGTAILKGKVDEAIAVRAPKPGRRLHWLCLSPPIQWTVLRTCLSAHQLRSLLAPFTDVLNRSDFDIQCEAARFASQHAEMARLLQGTLESQHRSALERASCAETEADLLNVWEDAVQDGDVRGAYWAIVTDRRTSSSLRSLVSSDVERGASETRDVKALVHENTELREQVERQNIQIDCASVLREHDAAEKSALRMQLSALDQSWRMNATLLDTAREARERAESLSSALMFQVNRREQAETSALAAEANVHRLEQESERLKHLLGELGRELLALEVQVRHGMEEGMDPTPLSDWIKGRKLLYVGGRPSSNPSIRALVESLGGEHRCHAGAIDTQKGQLIDALTWADMVVAPLDCFDRDSLLELKRACLLNGLDYVPLRTASVASFAAGIGAMSAASRPSKSANRLCWRHG